MPFPKQRFVVDWKRRVWRRWFHSYHFNFPSFSPSLPVPLLPLLLLLLLPHHSSTRFAFRGGCGATSHTIAHRGSKKLVWAWKPFPIFTNFLFPKRIFSTCGIITELDLWVRKVLYVIASHPLLSHCLICCQRLIARKHMCTPPNTIIPSNPRTPRGSLLSHFTEARICFKFGSRIESISFMSADT